MRPTSEPEPSRQDLLPLTGILETVLYCNTENEEATRLFYEDVLGLRRVSKWTYRLGPHLFLLFNSEETLTQSWPPPHGASGSGHICFTVAQEGYERWKEHLGERDVEVIEEIDWSRGVLSFYFTDPAGNMLEIANGDMWPEF
ncbi:MAG TPA: VOC family protein [Actinomycetota bacterium]|nr:VOC family protein [Actinomycetota bacterium]